MALTDFLVDEETSAPNYMEELKNETGDRYCACGCGEKLNGFKHEYKRGHKLAAMSSQVEDDPDGNSEGNEEAARNAPTRITKRIKDDIEGKAALGLSLISKVFEMRDPVCGSVLEQQVPAIAQAAVPLICKSPEMVRYLTKQGNMTAWVDLIVALAPVFKIIGQHHVLHTVGVEAEAETEDVNDYPMPLFQ